MKLYERPDFDRAFGGRFIDKDELPLIYWYDVVICFVPDLLVDCLYTLNRLHPVFEFAFNEMYETFTDTKNHKFFAYLNQASARVAGIILTSDLIHMSLALIKRLFE